MTDPTDSFCERCGTRYAFVADAPKGPSLKGARLLAKGLKNFVLTDGQSLSDALESARTEDGRDASTKITEAFHRTFNFCMQCRQYACESCWNAGAGACLSCAPMADSDLNLMPVSSQSMRGVVEQPQAAAEWSLFTDSPEQNTDPEPEPFWAVRPAPQQPVVAPRPEPAVPEPAFSEWAAEPRREMPEWPAADLQEVAAAAAASSSLKPGHGQQLRQVDPEAANVWPITDQIAPEMALTPGELALIQVQLSEAAPAEEMPSVAVQASAEPQHEAEPPAPATSPEQAGPPAEPPLLATTPTWWNRRPDDGETATAVGWSLDNPWAPDDADTVGPSPEPVVAELVSAEAAASPDANTEWAAASASDDAPPALTNHLLPRTLSAPVLPPLAAAPPAQAVPESGGLVARLFGRRTVDDASADSSPRAAANGRPSPDPWPHATRWSERPAESRRWWLETETPRAETWNSETPIQDVAPEYIEAPYAAAFQASDSGAAIPREPVVAATANHATIDPRSAAVLRLSAVESVGSYVAPGDDVSDMFATIAPAAPVPVPAAARADGVRLDLPVQEPARRRPPEHEPAWIRTQREATEAASARTPRHVELVSASESAARAMPTVPAVQATSAESQSTPQATPQSAPQAVPAAAQPPAPEIPSALPATAWPPLGASWSGREDPKAPWAVPEATVAPAAVAAAHAPAPTIAEMWVQSSQEVMNRGSVRVCNSCALPVSTQARFCRRCGTPQG